jgi:hypothetical protein
MIDLIFGDTTPYEKQGWSIFDTGDKLSSIQRIDDTRGWQESNGYDFIIPQLNSDTTAWKLAEKEGFILNYKGQILGKLKIKLVD